MHDSLVAGVSAMASLLSRTLGPSAAPVLSGGASLELIADSATLARRVTSLAGVSRTHNAGALLVRELARTVRQTYGDGAATATLLAEAMVRQANRLINAGAQPVDVRRGIDRAIDSACRSLTAQATAAHEEELRGLVASAIHDAELGDLVAEMYDLLGDHAALHIEERAEPAASAIGRHVDHEYVEGARWTARPADRAWLPEGTSELTLHEPLVVVVDGALRQADDVVPVLDLAHCERRPLLLVSRDVDDEALRILLTMRSRPDSPLVAPWCLASAGTRVGDDLDDLAMLTGATVLTKLPGCRSGVVRLPSCGTTRRASLAKAQLTVSGSTGDPAGRIEALDARLRRTPPGHEANVLRLRLARLSGSLGVITITGGTDPERALCRDRIENAQRVLESARVEGVVAGGGTAYLRCRPDVLSTRAECRTDDERRGVEVVLTALEAPFRRLVGGSGSERPEQPSIAELRRAGVIDSAGVARGALRSAGSLAGALISTALVVPGGAGG